MDAHHKAQSSNHLIRKLGSGEYADAYLSLPTTAIHQATEASLSGHEPRSTTLRNLRAHLQVTKTTTPNPDPQPHLDHEIAVLTYLQTQHRHPNLITLLDADAHPPQTWYTMRPVCLPDAATLETLCHEDRQGRLPTGLAWHLAAQLVSALRYLHFGSHEARPAPDPEWRVRAHGDLNPGNMRFHVPARGYPDLILIDFGHACFVERETASPPDRRAQTRRAGDVTNVLSWLAALEQSLASDDSGADSEGEGPQDDDDDDDDGPFGRAVSELRRGTREGRRPEEIHAALGAFLEVAAVMRERMYEELGGEMLEFFGGGREVVTDEELAGVVPVLKE